MSERERSLLPDGLQLHPLFVRVLQAGQAHALTLHPLLSEGVHRPGEHAHHVAPLRLVSEHIQRVQRLQSTAAATQKCDHFQSEYAQNNEDVGAAEWRVRSEAEQGSGQHPQPLLYV